MKTEKPYGKGFTGFIIGLLLATLIIGGLVYVLENNRKRDFKDPIVEKELPPPEVLTPKLHRRLPHRRSRSPRPKKKSNRLSRPNRPKPSIRPKNRNRPGTTNRKNRKTNPRPRRQRTAQRSANTKQITANRRIKTKTTNLPPSKY